MSVMCSVRIICDPALKDRVLDEAGDLGATDVTWWEARGKPPRARVEAIRGRHRRAGGQLRAYIEVWCDVDVADRLVEYCRRVESHGVGMIAALAPLLVQEEESQFFKIEQSADV